MDEIQTTAEGAQVLAQLGLPVFPLFGIIDAGTCECGRTGCSSAGKHPRINDFARNATTEPSQIAEWWRRWPNANIGIPTGFVSGIFVIDIDAKNGGVEAFASLVKEEGLDIEPTTAVLTGSGGGSMHLYFRCPVGMAIKNSASNIAPGVDVRGDGGYVVAPYSRHASGSTYSLTQYPRD